MVVIAFDRAKVSHVPPSNVMVPSREYRFLLRPSLACQPLHPLLTWAEGLARQTRFASLDSHFPYHVHSTCTSAVLPPAAGAVLVRFSKGNVSGMVCCAPAVACIVILVGCSNLALSGDAELTLLRKSTNFALTAHVYCRMLTFHSCTRHASYVVLCA